MKITATQYAKALYALTVGKTEREVGAAVSGLAGLLRKSRQEKLLEKIVQEFGTVWNEKHQVVEAEVVSRERLTDELLSKVRTYIRTRYQAEQVVIREKADADIKGGIIIRVGDEVLDGSVAGRLAKLKDVLVS